MEIEQGINQEYAEAFGLETQPASEQNGAENGQRAENTPNPAPAAAENAAERAGGTEEPSRAGNAEEPAERQEMPPEERSRQAFGRRAREAAQRAEQARVDQVYAEMFAGQVNPYTGKPITSEAEYQAYQAEKARREQEQQLQRAGIQPEAIQSIVDRQLEPVREQLLQAQMAAAQERARAVNAKAQEIIGAEVQKISAVYPEIKSLDDIVALPTGKEFNRLVQLGNTVEEAFYLANRKEIETRKLAAARTAALHGVAGKSHLAPMSAMGGNDPVEVPTAMREAYREMMPDATDAEIKKAYEKYLKDLKK